MGRRSCSVLIFLSSASRFCTGAVKQIHMLGKCSSYGVVLHHRNNPLLCFVKEDLRELHEEPPDPQAQQEIINSIEEVYFSNDSFDIVKYELEVS